MHGSDVRFYKYLSPSDAIAVLEKKTLKWSSSRLFNDPFDLPCEIDFSFSSEEFAKALIEEQVRLVYGEEEPTGDMSHPFFALLIRARKMRNKPSKDIFFKQKQPVTLDTEARFINGQKEIRACFRFFREQFAILCVSEVYDNLPMWAHYAQGHSGCVFKLRCLPEMDRPLCMAQKVIYQPEYPLIASLGDYVKHLTGQALLNNDKLFKIFAFTKSEHWKYEQEWRCISLLKDKKSGFHFDPLVPEELEGVFLGCRIKEKIKENVLQLIEKSFPSTKVYKARTDTQRYGLMFDKIR